MTLPQIGRLGGCEQPQGLPGQPAESHPESGGFLLALRVEQPFGQRSVTLCLTKAAVTSAHWLGTRDRPMRHDFES